MSASSSISAVPKRSGAKQTRQRRLTAVNARAPVTFIGRQGVFGRHRWSYWKFLMTVATRYRHCVGAAMTLAVMGYHFQVMTRRLCANSCVSVASGATQECLPSEQVQ